MIDTKFYTNTGPYSVKTLIELVGGEPLNVDIEKKMTGVAPLNLANNSEITFYHNPKYKEALAQSKAGLCILHPDQINSTPNGMGVLLTPTPYRLYAKIAGIFYKEKPIQQMGIHPTAFVSSSAKIGKECSIGAFVVIHDDVEIGDYCVIEANSVINQGVIIGHHCYVGAHVSISHSHIGNHVYIKSGARIGQKGFGFDISEEGHFSIPQLGRVLIHDYVEIGANTTVDRGASGDTIIYRNVRIDNLVQIGHNVVVGDGSILVSQVGVSGSTKIGKNVIAAGQAGLTGHIQIGDNARILAKSAVIGNVKPDTVVMGYPAINHRDFLRQAVILKQMLRKK